jgi:hypothetical protein
VVKGGRGEIGGGFKSVKVLAGETSAAGLFIGLVRRSVRDGFFMFIQHFLDVSSKEGCDLTPDLKS